MKKRHQNSPPLPRNKISARKERRNRQVRSNMRTAYFLFTDKLFRKSMKRAPNNDREKSIPAIIQREGGREKRARTHCEQLHDRCDITSRRVVYDGSFNRPTFYTPSPLLMGRRHFHVLLGGPFSSA